MVPARWPEEWSVGDATLLSDGIGGKVWRVALPGGGTAIVKHLSDLAIRDRADGEAWLRWRGGSSAIRLLDRRGPLLLLEDAGGLSLLDVFHRHGDDAATEIAGWVVRELHQPTHSPAPSALVTLRDHFSGLFVRASHDSAAGMDTWFVAAARLAQRLLDDQRGVSALHGDLHHENLLLSPRGWLAIDPKGIAGDPGYEAANWFYNPLESSDRFDPVRAMEVAETLAPVLGRSPEALLDWGTAHAALSASWHLEDGNGEEAEKSLQVSLAVAEAARQFRS